MLARQQISNENKHYVFTRPQHTTTSQATRVSHDCAPDQQRDVLVQLDEDPDLVVGV